MNTYLLESIQTPIQSVQTTANKKLRQQIIDHPFWKAIEKGKLEKKKLALFALQDMWLVRQASRIDTLIIASMQDKSLHRLLLERLAKQVMHGRDTLTDFALSVGVTKKDLEHIVPIAGCMALTTFFYWMIDNTGDLEKIVCIDASKEIFSLLCVKVKEPLKKYYGLSEKDVAFFTVHEGWEDRLGPVDEYIKKNCTSKEAKTKVNEAIRLAYENELLFYDTLMSASVPGQ